MDFSLDYTPEQEVFAGEVRAWLKANVPPGLADIRDTLKMDDEQWGKRRELARRLGARGWLYPGYPQQYGGGGLDGAHAAVIREELSRISLSLPPLYDMGVLAGPAILACGTEEQKQRYLTPICRGDVLTWQLFTEPEAGTDEANQQTNALRSSSEGEYFIINGQKIFVGSYPSRPEQFYLLTRCDLKAPRHQNLAMFVIPANLPGITVQALDLFPIGTFGSASGVTAASSEGVKHAVYFDNVKVHQSHLIGKEGEGWKVTNATLEVEHGGGGGRVARSVLAERFFEQCKSNPNIARRLKDNPQLLERLVDVYIGTQVQRLLSMRNLAGKGGAYGGPQLTVYSKAFGTRAIADMAKVLGPYAMTSDETWGLEQGMFEVGERSGICQAPGGTPEALKIGISRALGIGR